MSWSGLDKTLRKIGAVEEDKGKYTFIAGFNYGKRQTKLVLTISTAKLLLAEISVGAYNFSRWTSKPAENYFANSERSCKLSKLYTIMKNAMVLDWY